MRFGKFLVFLLFFYLRREIEFGARISSPARAAGFVNKYPTRKARVLWSLGAHCALEPSARPGWARSLLGGQRGACLSSVADQAAADRQ